MQPASRVDGNKRRLVAAILLFLFGLLLLSETAAAEAQEAAPSTAPLYCLVANSTCYSDTTCYPLLSSVSKWCGNYTAGRCSWTKEQHCLSILRTLKNRPPFKDCHCRQEQFDHAELQRCRQVHRFVQNHPCLELASPPPTLTDGVTDATDDADTETDVDTEVDAEVDANADGNQGKPAEEKEEDDEASPATPVIRTVASSNASCELSFDNLANCMEARRQCASQQVCGSLLNQFRELCKGRADKCVALQSDALKCNEVYRELNKHAPHLFVCRCDDIVGDVDKFQRCDKSQRMFRNNACVQYVLPNCKSPSASLPSQSNSNSLTDTSDRTRKNNELALITTDRTWAARKDASDCYDVVSECYNNETCRTRLGSMLHWCRFSVQPKTPRTLRQHSAPWLAERCDSSACATAVADFYSSVGRKLAQSAAFCSCPQAHSPDYANCLKHQEYLRPSCAFAPQPTPTCIDLLRGCYNRNGSLCREAMKIFHVDCKVSTFVSRNANDTCMYGANKCRQAILRMIPRGLVVDACTCDNVSNSTRASCLDIRNNLFNNTCVADALSIISTANSRSRFGFSAANEQSRSVLSQTPTGFNDSSSGSDTCAKLTRFSKVSSGQFRLYERYRTAGSEVGCSEIVRCDSLSASRQTSSRWCENDLDFLASVNKNRTRKHTAFLQPLASLCVNNTIRSSFVVYSSVSQQCVCHYTELVCSTVSTSHATNKGLLLHIGYSTSEADLLQAKTAEEFDVDVITAKLSELLNGPSNLCVMQLVNGEQAGHLVFSITSGNQGDEFQEDLSHCLSASRLLAQLINQRHPFVTHDPDLSLVRTATVQTDSDSSFSNDLSAFQLYLQSDFIANSQVDSSTKAPRKESALRKGARVKDELMQRSAANFVSCSLVQLLLITFVASLFVHSLR